MLGLIACVCATLVVTEGLQLWRVYQTNNQQTEVVSANIARSLADQADAALKTADTIAASLVERVEADGLSPEAKHRLYGLMTSLAAALPAIHEMGITDPRGNAIVKSLVPDPTGLNYAERAYFQYHATHPSRRPFIGERIRSKIDQTDNITVTRRIDQPDGSFGGVVVTSVSLGYFQRLFDQIQAKSGGIIALVADDGTVLVRSPASSDIDRPSEGAGVARQIRGHPEAGTVSYVSAIDGVRRRGAYVRLAHYPLTVLVSQSVWDLQSGWRGELHAHAVILGCFLIVVAALATLAVKASRILNAQATHNSLTGLANRCCFDQTIEAEFRRAARSGQPVSIVMIDLDGFKSYNDRYGHPAGDDCLRDVGRTVQGCLRRAGDFAARYGGEEIVVVLPGYDAPSARALAETIRLAVCGLALRHLENPPGIVTLSAGVATVVPGGSGVGWRALVREADTALYAAKKAGRNRVMSSAPTPFPEGAEKRRVGVPA